MNVQLKLFKIIVRLLYFMIHWKLYIIYFIDIAQLQNANQNIYKDPGPNACFRGGVEAV